MSRATNRDPDYRWDAVEHLLQARRVSLKETTLFKSKTRILHVSQVKRIYIQGPYFYDMPTIFRGCPSGSHMASLSGLRIELLVWVEVLQVNRLEEVRIPYRCHTSTTTSRVPFLEVSHKDCSTLIALGGETPSYQLRLRYLWRASFWTGCKSNSPPEVSSGTRKYLSSLRPAVSSKVLDRAGT